MLSRIKKGEHTFVMVEHNKFKDITDVRSKALFKNIIHKCSCSYEDDIWVFVYEIYQNNVYFIFSDLNEKDKQILKTWCTVNLLKIGLQQQRKWLNHIKSAIETTNHFNENYWECLYEHMLLADAPEIDLVNNYINFLSFSEMGDFEFYISKLKSLNSPSKSRAPRKIIDWHTIIELDYIIAIFFSSANTEEILKYYPVMIWWEFSRIIPMRVSEICLIKKDPLYLENGIYYIEIPTIKRKHNVGEIKYSPVAITREMYDFFNNYLTLVSYDTEREYIFSFQESRKYKSKLYSSEDDKTFFSATNMTDLIDEFLKEVVSDKFGRKIIMKGAEKEEDYIESIDPGDTRHMAIHNMISQGVGPLTVQEFARHDSILSQIPYYDHLDVFYGTKVQVLADKIRLKMQDRTKAFFYDPEINGTIFSSRMGAITLIEHGKKEGYLHEINGAYCENIHYLKDCQPSGCKGCPYHIGELDSDESIIEEYVREEYKKSMRDIDIAINTIKGYFSDVNIREKSYLYKEQSQIIEQAVYRAALAKAKIDIISEE
jgi:hypothetical protein